MNLCIYDLLNFIAKYMEKNLLHAECCAEYEYTSEILLSRHFLHYIHY